MLTCEFRIEVLDAFTVLLAATHQLANAIEKDSTLMAWTQNTAASTKQHRSNAIQIIKQLEYEDLQAPRETILCAGFIGASEETLAYALTLNHAKDRFKKSIIALKGEKIGNKDPYLTEKFNTILSRAEETSAVLKKLGLARLHLKQCYRKIPILQAAPSKISWTWAHTRAIKKITVAKAHEMLIKKGKNPTIEIQLQKLQAMPAHEPLAIVQELAPHLRTNLVFKGESLERQMIKGPLPLFFPCTEETPRPEFSPPAPKQEKDKHRSQRSDVKIDPTVFLPAIRAHRYIT